MAKGTATGEKPRKSILLFSDGTGNSSSKLQKTNVWRLYEAADLGDPVNHNPNKTPAETGDVQIAYYDDGVGTSAFKLLAILGGVFGFGLARNVRDLYKFLCRNYQPGDRIYAFGFSRGAYTIRLLVALITSMGVMRYSSEAELDARARDAWREFRRLFHTNNFVSDFLVSLGRAIVRLYISQKRKLFGPVRYADGIPATRPMWIRDWYDFWWKGEPGAGDRNAPAADTEVEFVGVWDTVAAYGGPLIELTRAIDEWIWPLSMPDYRLSPNVKCARHALAIDDKRDAFQPLLWDEVNEAEDPELKKRAGRMQQVWFAGMHADVGGGYSDEALSYVSLFWMIEHAEQAGLRLLPDTRERIRSVQNAFGPIHNSRGGGGSLYRYQPRYINAWIDRIDEFPEGGHVRPATQIYRDQSIDRGRYRNRGLLCEPIRLHKSVEKRLATGTDGYGPVNLPVSYVVDDGVRGPGPAAATHPISVPHIIELGDRIKIRRIWYMMTLLSIAALVLMPWWAKHDAFLLDALKDLNKSASEVSAIVVIFGYIAEFLPGLAITWIEAFAQSPVYAFLLAAIALFSLRMGGGQEWAMNDIAKAMWIGRFEGRQTKLAPVPVWSRWLHDVVHFIRRNNAIQALLAWIKWHGVPQALGFAIWAAIICLVWQIVRLAIVTWLPA